MKRKPITPRTLAAEYSAGRESGKHPTPDNDRKAREAAADPTIAPLVRAYWQGYSDQRAPA